MVALLVGATALAACQPADEPEQQAATTQAQEQATRLFPDATKAQYIVKYEGCQVYVAEHAGNTLYLTYNIRSVDQCSVAVVPGTATSATSAPK